MIATAWLGLPSWQELEAPSVDATAAGPALPYLRFALLLLLSALGESEWAPLDELASQLSDAVAGMGPDIVRRSA